MMKFRLNYDDIFVGKNSPEEMNQMVIGELGKKMREAGLGRPTGSIVRQPQVDPKKCWRIVLGQERAKLDADYGYHVYLPLIGTSVPIVRMDISDTRHLTGGRNKGWLVVAFVPGQYRELLENADSRVIMKCRGVRMSKKGKEELMIAARQRILSDRFNNGFTDLLGIPLVFLGEAQPTGDDVCNALDKADFNRDITESGKKAGRVVDGGQRFDHFKARPLTAEIEEGRDQ